MSNEEPRGGTRKDMTHLGSDFQPGEFDVICAKGNHAKNHIGNVRYRKMVDDFLSQYDSAPSKTQKSTIVSAILDKVRELSPSGGFIKIVDGRWMEVGDHVAREKIGQSLRDRLHTKYSSSTQAKKRRRKLLESQPFFGQSTIEPSVVNRELRYRQEQVETGAHQRVTAHEERNRDWGNVDRQNLGGDESFQAPVPPAQATTGKTQMFPSTSLSQFAFQQLNVQHPPRAMDTLMNQASETFSHHGSQQLPVRQGTQADRGPNSIDPTAPLKVDTADNIEAIQDPSFVSHIRRTFLEEARDSSDMCSSKSDASQDSIGGNSSSSSDKKLASV